MRFVFLSLFLVTAAPRLAADFAADAKVWQEQHTEIFDQAAKLSADGYAKDGNQILLSLAEDDGSPIAAFLVANTLYGADPAASYRLHLRAQQALPNESAVILAAALEQHRKGEYPAAILNYRGALNTGSGPQYSALLADCLIRTGQQKAAVQAWNDANHRQNQPAIDAAIGAVYGPLVPAQRRGDLIAKIEAGDQTKLSDLVLLDLSFDTDWWHATVNSDALDRDLQRAAELLGRKDARYHALAVYAKLARTAEKRASEIQKVLTNGRFIIGPGAELPVDSKIARALCELAVNANLATTADLWAAYETPLRARLEQQDRDALHLLCWLAAANHNPVLSDLDRLGWEEWNDPAFASSYMVDLLREKKLTTATDSQLLAAIAIAPDNATLATVRIALAGDDVTTDMIAAAIKAEYHKLSVTAGVRDSSTLNNLYFELGKRL